VSRNRVQAAERALFNKIADQLSELIAPRSTHAVPTLVTSLPREAPKPTTVRYILGPQTLSRLLSRGNEAIQFEGGAEAVVAEYPQGVMGAGPLRMLIVEYHTPQYASDAMGRLNAYVEALPQEERDRTVARRVGNYLVLATDVRNPELAARLADSVTYPYGVKWLKNPDIIDGDPYYGQKTAQVLLSTFGIIGLVMVAAGVVGTTFGAIIFLRRRRRLRAIFSDAGGMLRLDIDPLPGTSIGAGHSGGLLGSGEE
jgi:hypothetical protein